MYSCRKRAASCIFKGKHRAECESGELYFRIMWQAKCEQRLADDLRGIWWFIGAFFHQSTKSHRKHLSISRASSSLWMNQRCCYAGEPQAIQISLIWSKSERWWQLWLHRFEKIKFIITYNCLCSGNQCQVLKCGAAHLQILSELHRCFLKLNLSLLTAHWVQTGLCLSDESQRGGKQDI